jgi:hypothetical protein
MIGIHADATVGVESGGGPDLAGGSALAEGIPRSLAE